MYREGARFLASGSAEALLEMRARLGTVVGALVLLALARLLPASGIGLYLRLATATAVVLLPGRLLVGAGSVRDARAGAWGRSRWRSPSSSSCTGR